MRETTNIIFEQWARIGAGFGAEPSLQTPDIERLLLRTAHAAPDEPRLFIMAATWLHRYGDLIAKKRLKRLIQSELEPLSRSTIGLLLESAQQGTRPLEFQSVIRDLSPTNPPLPLFRVEQRSEVLRKRCERNASELSKHWGLWCAPFEFKFDALRPARWIMAQNPLLITRADLRGDLRASVLASLRHDSDAGSSESALARACGGSRAQVREALKNLELTCRVRRELAQNKRRTIIHLDRVA